MIHYFKQEILIIIHIQFFSLKRPRIGKIENINKKQNLRKKESIP
jgi:hypothetical protein